MPANVTLLGLFLLRQVAFELERAQMTLNDTRPIMNRRTTTDGSRITSCVSCMSMDYQEIWHLLMYRYFPPKNFTQACENPSGHHNVHIGTVPCTGACLTILETVPAAGLVVDHRVMRGCINRMLLFGFDDNWLEVTGFNRRRICRLVDPRKLLLNELRPEKSGRDNHFSKIQSSTRGKIVRTSSLEDFYKVPDNSLIVCSCHGTLCNDDLPILVTVPSSNAIKWTTTSHYLLIIIIITAITHVFSVII